MHSQATRSHVNCLGDLGRGGRGSIAVFRNPKARVFRERVICGKRNGLGRGLGYCTTARLWDWWEALMHMYALLECDDDLRCCDAGENHGLLISG